MDGFIFVIILFLAFVLLMIFFISSAKGKRSACLVAVTATLSAWFIGLVLDANIDFGEPAGFLSLRILFPILAMGLCILNTISKDMHQS